MLIELEGVEFKNKGAELMVHTIIREVGNAIPEAKFALRPRSDRPFEKRAELILLQKLEFRKYGLDWGNIGGYLIPSRIKRHFGVVTEHEVDIVLDASGLGYSDKWGVNAVKSAAYKYRSMKKNGSRIIMLPQAFGPFKDQSFKKYLKLMVKNTDLIYARESMSFKYLTDVVGKDEKIKIAPDFTNLIEPVITKKARSRENCVCIIPNYRMIDKTDDSISKNYVSFMASLIEELEKRGEEVFMLIHEGQRDMSLAKKIEKRTKTDIDIIKEENPLIIKGIISNSKGVISSRFHGLVSALSTGVPALATGWSHKYEFLFKDYEFPDGMLEVNMLQKEMELKLDILTDDDQNKKLASLLKRKSQELKQGSRKMFTNVISLIQN